MIEFSIKFKVRLLTASRSGYIVRKQKREIPFVKADGKVKERNTLCQSR